MSFQKKIVCESKPKQRGGNERDKKKPANADLLAFTETGSSSSVASLRFFSFGATNTACLSFFLSARTTSLAVARSSPVLQCVAVCCSVLQCGAGCCSVLQGVAVCCSVLQASVALCCVVRSSPVLQCVAGCCNWLQWVAVGCSVLQCVVDVCRRVLHVMGLLQLVGSIKSQVSFAEYSLFYRALLHKRTIILSILLTEATPYSPTAGKRRRKRVPFGF